MHAMESNSAGCGDNSAKGKKSIDSANELKCEDEESRKSPKVPQGQQNGAALPEEAASADRTLLHGPPGTTSLKKEKKEAIAGADSGQHHQTLLAKSGKLQSTQAASTPSVRPTYTPGRPGRPPGQRSAAARLQQQQQQQLQQQQQQQQIQLLQQPARETRKRRIAEVGPTGASGTTGLPSNGGSPRSPKRLCLDQKEQFINSLIGGSDKLTSEQLSARAEQLRAEVQDLDELARAKEIEWNEILSMRKLKEEAFLRLERRRQVMGFMESSSSNGPMGASLVLGPQQSGVDTKPLLVPKEERPDVPPQDSVRGRTSRAQPWPCPKQSENGPRAMAGAQSPEHRQIGEGRQGPIVDVKSIIADYRLRHPEAVPRRRGRRLRNPVNIGLGTGGAVVENIASLDCSRPSSTDSCKSNSNPNDPHNAMSYKDVLVQFAKLSQQQDVTLHPVSVAPGSQHTTAQNSTPSSQSASGSLLHGILTKSQSPRPTTFSPTLARLLTAPERERAGAPTALAPGPHHTASQQLLQAYQGANSVSISDFLSSSKARTEITITPVVNNPVQSHPNNLINVDDGEEDNSVIEERDSRLAASGRDNRDDKESTPRCQGCRERTAQFVCAGCGNQWYCSRECQVAAWDEHSEVCSG